MHLTLTAILPLTCLRSIAPCVFWTQTWTEDGGNGLNGTFIIDAIRSEFGGISIENDGREPIVGCSKADGIGTHDCPRYEGDQFADASITSEASYKEGLNNIVEGSVLSLTRSLEIKNDKMENALQSLYGALQKEVATLVQAPPQHEADKVATQEHAPLKANKTPDLDM